MRARTVRFWALAVTLSVPGWAYGAAITVLGNSEAHDCYLRASLSSTAVGSLESCRKALARGDLSVEDRAATHVNMGIILNQLGRVDEAMDAFEQALGLSPDLPEAILSRGNSYFLKKDYDRAIADYELSLEHGVKDASAAHFNHGLAHGKKRNFDEAARSYRRALEIKPDFHRARQHLDRLHALGLVRKTAPPP